MALDNSIFDLPSSIEELRRPEDVIKVQTRKINPTSSSKMENFPGSDIVFDFTLSGNQHWIPSRSYVVIKSTFLYGTGGVAIVPAIGEELLFRGVLQQLFIKWTGKIHVGIFVSSFLFSVFRSKSPL